MNILDHDSRQRFRNRARLREIRVGGVGGREINANVLLVVDRYIGRAVTTLSRVRWILRRRGVYRRIARDRRDLLPPREVPLRLIEQVLRRRRDVHDCSTHCWTRGILGSICAQWTVIDRLWIFARQRTQIRRELCIRKRSANITRDFARVERVGNLGFRRGRCGRRGRRTRRRRRRPRVAADNPNERDTPHRDSSNNLRSHRAAPWGYPCSDSGCTSPQPAN